MSRASTPIVLEHTGEVGMTGSRTSDPPAADLAGDSASCAITSSQFAQSRLGISMATGEPSVSPARTPAEPLDVIALDLHPGAAAVPLHPAIEVAIDPLSRYGEARRQPLDQGDEPLPVGFPGGGETQVHGGLGENAKRRGPSGSDGK